MYEASAKSESSVAAQKIGTTHISLEVANEGIEQAKGYMEEAMKTGNLKDMIANLTGKGRA